jgi:predicted acyl esterase
MRDGVRLAANLYLPEDGGQQRLPVLVQYTPYLKDGRGGRGPIETAQMYFAQRGYACVSLDMRGYGCSEGVPAPPFSDSEQRDGYDALRWLAGQPWCDGHTGMWGISYGGDTALSVASLQPPSLGAIVPIHAIDDEFTGVCYPHGCRGGHIGEVDWGFRMVGLQLLPPLRFDARGHWEKLWRARLEVMEPAPFTWHTIPPATWASWRADISAIRAPTYAVSAWHDSYPAETLDYYSRLQAPKRMLMGPWKHEVPDRATHYPIGFWQEMTRWWDYWLKGLDTGVVSEPPVTIFDPAAGWRFESAWPPSRSTHEYYFHAASRLAAAPPSMDSDQADSYTVDPSVGLSHLPWDWTTPTPALPPDISPDDHRAMAYTTEPLTEAMDICGNPEVIVHVSVDQPDLPLVAWLADVNPTGYSTLICQGWIRASHAAGERLQAGKVYEFRVPLNPTAYHLAAGHRLRVALAGACFPMLISAPANPTLHVHRTVAAASRLLLPVRGNSAMPWPRPSFGEPMGEEPEAYLPSEADYRTWRDLQDRRAGYRMRHAADFRLEAGTRLHTELEFEAAIDSANPRRQSLAGTQVLLVERAGGGPIRIQAEAHETFDLLRITAEIHLNDRLYFRRAWELDLYRSEWAYRST